MKAVSKDKTPAPQSLQSSQSADTRNEPMRIRNARKRWEARKAANRGKKIQPIAPPLPKYEIPPPIPFTVISPTSASPSPSKTQFVVTGKAQIESVSESVPLTVSAPAPAPVASSLSSSLPSGLNFMVKQSTNRVSGKGNPILNDSRIGVWLFMNVRRTECCIFKWHIGKASIYIDSYHTFLDLTFVS